MHSPTKSILTWVIATVHVNHIKATVLIPYSIRQRTLVLCAIKGSTSNIIIYQGKGPITTVFDNKQVQELVKSIIGCCTVRVLVLELILAFWAKSKSN